MARASCTNGTAQQKPGFDSCHPALSLLSIQSEGRSQKAVFVLFGVVALGLLSRGCKVVYAKVITGQLKTGLRRALHKRTLAVEGFRSVASSQSLLGPRLGATGSTSANACWPIRGAYFNLSWRTSLVPRTSRILPRSLARSSCFSLGPTAFYARARTFSSRPPSSAMFLYLMIH